MQAARVVTCFDVTERAQVGFINIDKGFVIAKLGSSPFLSNRIARASESRADNTDNTLASISVTGVEIGDLTYGWNEHALVFRLQSATENNTT